MAFLICWNRVGSATVAGGRLADCARPVMTPLKKVWATAFRLVHTLSTDFVI